MHDKIYIIYKIYILLILCFIYFVRLSININVKLAILFKLIQRFLKISYLLPIYIKIKF